MQPESRRLRERTPSTRSHEGRISLPSSGGEACRETSCLALPPRHRRPARAEGEVTVRTRCRSARSSRAAWSTFRVPSTQSRAVAEFAFARSIVGATQISGAQICAGSRSEKSEVGFISLLRIGNAYHWPSRNASSRRRPASSAVPDRAACRTRHAEAGCPSAATAARAGYARGRGPGTPQDTARVRHTPGVSIALVRLSFGMRKDTSSGSSAIGVALPRAAAVHIGPWHRLPTTGPRLYDRHSGTSVRTSSGSNVHICHGSAIRTC
jgi:hypothetical protein